MHLRRRSTPARTASRARRGLAVLVVAAVTACGSAEPASETPVSTAPPVTGGASVVDAGATRVVTHPFGETTVPADPQRIVALGEEFLLADLLDLGVVPVASTATTGTFVGIDPALTEGIEPLVSFKADIEKLIDLEPDVIITSTAIAELVGYERLDDVAPTVAIDGSDWRRSYLDTATVFGRDAQAESRLADYDQLVADAAETLDADGRTVSVATLYYGDALAFWTAGPVNVPQVLIDLGFTLTPDDDLESSGGRAYVSIEQLDLAAGDDLVMMQTSSVEGEDAGYEAFTESGLWQALAPVQAGRVLVVDRLGYPGLLGREALVERFLEDLA
jgi:iron complex transport system substrate-binding protein